MARLLIHLLGPFQVLLDGQPVSGFESDKVRALLAFLAVENDQPHRRERLAGLLWPERAERSARANLRRALVNLRKVSDDYHATPPFLDITPQTIQFNHGADAWVDAVALRDLVGASAPQAGSLVRDESIEPQIIHRWEEAIDLYRGEFLAGFSLRGCPDFDEWVLFEQEELNHMVMDTLCRLATWYEGQGKLEQALRYAWRQTELDPWRESGYRQIMRLLAHTGRRAAALDQYKTCRSRLADGLGVEPSVETTRLYQRIRDNELEPPVEMPIKDHRPEPAPKLAAFLVRDAETGRYQPQPFVARERELTRLDDFLQRSISGEGQIAFVTGGTGRGKTALLNEFARQAMALHPELLVANGRGDAYSGVGDPYLPFREMLGMLTGDVESLWAAGAIDRGHARRLWQALPIAIQALLEHGPHIAPVLVPREALLARASAAAVPVAHLERLRERIEQRGTQPEGLEQSHLFQQVSNTLRALAKVHPLLLILDDLQWADLASAGLLFHLGRRLEGARVLIAGAYRPEEVALGLEGQSEDTRHSRVPPLHSRVRRRHPLGKALAEFKRIYGDVWLDLAEVDASEGRRFVDGLLETESNRLGEAFRQTLVERAGGHPLFTIELLRAMQERGDLVRDEARRWVEGPALDWEVLPARVEGVITERIERLDGELRDILAVASVEGEDFTAELVAHVRSIEPRELVRRLSGELQKEHRLVRSRGLRRVASQRLALYRFQHYLFQQYLYSSLDEGERAYLHEDVGRALESLYGGQTDEVAVQLARHFLEAGVTDKAVHYLGRAGELAAERYANEEAVVHLSRALALLPQTDLLGRYGMLLAREQVYDLMGQREAQRQDLVDLEELARGLGAEQQAEVAERQSRYARRAGDYARAAVAANIAVSQAQAARHVGLQVKGHHRWAAALYRQGDFAGAQAQYERMLALARSAGQRDAEAIAVSNLANLVSDLHDPAGEQDRQRDLFEQALSLSRQAGDQLGEMKAVNGLSLNACTRGDYATAWAHSSAFLRLSVKVGSRKSEELARGNFGHLCDLLGDHTKAGRLLEQCLQISREIEAPYSESRAFLYLAMASQCQAHHDKARSFAEQALRLSQRIGAQDVEIWALHYMGAVHMDTGDLGAARTAFEESLTLLRSQESLAGLAGTALAQGKLGEAQSKVAEIREMLDAGKSPDCFFKPSWIYLTCYRVLEAAGEPRASEILADAHRMLTENADRTPDERLRRSYLENVPWNREIARLARGIAPTGDGMARANSMSVHP